MFSDILLTSDYDLTLTGPDGAIPERNLQAIRYFMDHGGTFTVNTGRSIPMIKRIRDTVPVNAPWLLYNGSAAYDMAADAMIFCHEIRENMWKLIPEVMEKFPDMTVEVQGLKAHYRFLPEDPLWDALCDSSDCARDVADPHKDMGPFLKFALYGTIRSEKITDMFNATAPELERMKQVMRQLQDAYGDFLEVFHSGARILDVHAKGASKGRSARELKAKLGKKILICAGDGYNDVPMLQAADYAFCPCDAVIADRFPNLCPCAEGSIADLIYEEIPKIL